MRNAAVMLIIKDGLILGVSRRYDKTKWGLPGGKQEPDETPKEAACRECFEETGVKVSDCIFLYYRDEPRDRPEGEDFHAYCYFATEWSGTPQSFEEGEVAWLTEADLTGDRGAFPDYNRETIKVYRTKFPTIK